MARDGQRQSTSQRKPSHALSCRHLRPKRAAKKEAKSSSGILASASFKPLTEWLESDIIEKYGDSILPFDMDAAKKWGEIMAEADSVGRPRPPLNAQIVAIALAHNLVIVTRNVSDMNFAGVKVINPFSK